MAGQPYLQPISGMNGGYVVARPFPVEAAAPPVVVQRRGIPWPIKLGVAGGATLAAWYVGAKVLQGQNINVGCPSGQAGIYPFCGPGSSVTPGCNPPCPSGQSCVNGTCVSSGGGGGPQPPAYVTFNSKTSTILDYSCQASENNDIGQCGCCGQPTVCHGAITITGTIFDKNNAPVPNQLIPVAAQGQTAIQPAGFNVPDHVQTDANGNFSIPLVANSNSDPGTSCCGPEYSEDGPYPIGTLIVGGGVVAIPGSLNITINYKRYQPNLTGSCPGDCQQSQWQNCTVSW